MTTGASTTVRNRRRTLLIKRGLQIKYGLVSVATFSAAALLVWWEFSHGFQGNILFFKVLIALGVVWSLSLVLSHYLAGPIYRLESSLKLLKAGDLVHRIQLRRKDELQGLVAAYNEALDSLQGRVESDRDAVIDVIHRLETLALTETSPETAAKLQAAANKLKDVSAGFSI